MEVLRCLDSWGAMLLFLLSQCLFGICHVRESTVGRMWESLRNEIVHREHYKNLFTFDEEKAIFFVAPFNLSRSPCPCSMAPTTFHTERIHSHKVPSTNPRSSKWDRQTDVVLHVQYQWWMEKSNNIKTVCVRRRDVDFWLGQWVHAQIQFKTYMSNIYRERYHHCCERNLQVLHCMGRSLCARAAEQYTNGTSLSAFAFVHSRLLLVHHSTSERQTLVVAEIRSMFRLFFDFFLFGKFESTAYVSL